MTLPDLSFDLIMTVVTVSLGTPLLVGYQIAIPNLLKENMEKYMSRSSDKIPNQDWAYSFVGGFYVIGAALGAFTSGFLADRFGRRRSIIVNHVINIVGAGVSAICFTVDSSTVLYIARLIFGINSGLGVALSSIFLAEISPRNLRGVIGACTQLAITFGIVLCYALTLSSVLNTEKHWISALVITVVPSILALVYLPFCPSSPRYLYLCKKNEGEARKAFARLNVSGNADQYFRELNEEVEAVKSQPEFKFLQIFTRPDLRLPLLLGCCVQILQQLSGINAVMTYSSDMLETAGVLNKDIEYYVLAIGAVNFAVTIVALPFLEKFGRRSLLLWPTIAVAVSLLVLTVTTTIETDDASVRANWGIVSVVLIMIYIVGFAIGLGPIPALIVSEIFLQGPRAAAYSLSQCLQWTCNFLVLIGYPSINNAIKGYSFIIFLVIVVSFWIFFFIYMPETKNRTFDDIAGDLAVWKKAFRGRTTKLSHDDVNNNIEAETNDTKLNTEIKNLSVVVEDETESDPVNSVKDQEEESVEVNRH